MALKVYADRGHYAEPHRKALNDILKALWNPATIEEKRATYGDHVDVFENVDAPEAADIHLLPMKWNHYVDNGRIHQALDAIAVARRARRPIAIFSAGDHPANVPAAGSDIHVFEASGYRSRREVSAHGMPPFIDDLLEGELDARERGPRPIVGFCGQAGATLAHHAGRYARNRIHKLRWRLGLDRWEPTPMEHTWFRRRVLDTFANSPSVQTKFIVRTQYRAGVRSETRNDPNDPARREFLDNLTGADYALCMRGGGNFSRRFYEALALGRMPIFIDTDCLLPFQDQVDWHRYIVWVDEKDLRDAPRRVAAYHAAMSPAEFRERQHECRKLWEERLTASGFYRHFHEHFPELRR